MDPAIIAIITVVLLLGVALAVYLLWPWKKPSIPGKFTGDIPDGKKCDISGDLWDFNGVDLNDTKSVPCDRCIQYLTKTQDGCFLTQYDGDSKCEKYGDPQPCPVLMKAGSYAKYKKV
jgi:hypothetical protein